jgi:hypothetical protein
MPKNHASSCRSIKLVPGKKHSFKSHFTGAAREVLGYYELLAAKDPERFAWCSVGDIVEHCKKYGSKRLYSKTAVERVKRAAEASGILVPAERERHGWRSGYIFNGCAELGKESFDGWCNLTISFSINWLRGKALDRETDGATVEATDGATEKRPKSDGRSDGRASEKIAASSDGEEGYKQPSAMSRGSRVLTGGAEPTLLPCVTVTKKAGEEASALLSVSNGEERCLKILDDITEVLSEHGLPTNIAPKYRKAFLEKAKKIGQGFLHFAPKDREDAPSEAVGMGGTCFLVAFSRWLATGGAALCKGLEQPLWKFLEGGYADQTIPLAQQFFTEILEGKTGLDGKPIPEDERRSRALEAVDWSLVEPLADRFGQEFLVSEFGAFWESHPGMKLSGDLREFVDWFLAEHPTPAATQAGLEQTAQPIDF